jgi:hypothetical protein
MFIVKITGTTHNCKDCDFRSYYSGGVHECTKAGAHLPQGEEHKIPSWCPLPDHPAIAMAKLEDEVKMLREMLTEAQNPKPRGKAV